ncbi:MAG: right-handed parallel beta-helix repeat-containing protein [Spirochaetales bacterium]|nr:right-handed parallel beta-helix repeat-containing protein [Spirochaetales bacterium]
MTRSLFLALCLEAPLLVSCLLVKDVIPVDLGPGKARQKETIEALFTGRDVRRPPASWPPSKGGVSEAVSAAWWGFDPADATSILQRALDSGAATVLVPRMDSPWQCDDIHVRSNTVLIMQEGAVLLAKKGGFRKRTQSLLNIVDVDDVTVSGYGAVIRMRQSDYLRPPYEKAEWRHTIRICGGNKITLAGLTTELSGGDGVYLGRGGTRITNTGIVLKDLILRDHYRQSISVITARGLTIENAEMSGTSGTPPGAGIDFEPNLADEPVVDCVLTRCLIHNNSGAGFQCYFANHNAASEPFDVTLDGCLVYGNLAGALAFGYRNGARGKIVFRNTRVFGFFSVPRIPGQVEFIEE